jgi:hypothetical protein
LKTLSEANRIKYKTGRKREDVSRPIGVRDYNVDVNGGKGEDDGTGVIVEGNLAFRTGKKMT